MQKAFNNFTWENLPSTNTALEADRLNGINNALDTVDDRVVAFDTTKANQSDMLQAVKTISFNSQTGTFRFTFFNNTYVDVDTDIEKIAINFDYDDDPTSAHYQNLIITLDDGTVKYVDMSALLTQYEFNNSSRISFSVVNGVVSADIINGSVTEEKLQPNFLADCRSAKAGAETAETNAKASEEDAEAWAVGKRNGVPVPVTDETYHNNAQYWASQANVTSLVALTDTDINYPKSGDVLTFNGEKWENKEGINGEEKTAVDEFETINGGLLSECKVALSPNQDLHGYPEPWVGGASKNKLPLVLADIKAINTEGTWNGNEYTYRGVTFTINTDSSGNIISINANNTASGNAILTIVNSISLNENYIVSGCPSGGSYNSSYSIWAISQNPYNEAIDSGNGVTITSNYSREIRIRIANGYTANNLLFYPMIRLATESDPTYEPYSNICPITGHTQAKVKDDGKNKLPNTVASITKDGVTFTVHSDGTVTLNGTSTNITSVAYEIIALNGTYILNGCPSGGGSGTYELQAVTTITSRDYGDGVTFTVNGDCLVQILVRQGVTLNNVVFKPMIRLASDTDPTFVPYNGYQVTVNLGGTYYSGLLDIVSGIFVADMAEKDVSASDLIDQYLDTTNNQYLAGINANAKIPSSIYTLGNVKCNELTPKSQNSLFNEIGGAICIMNSGTLRVTFSGVTTFADMQTWVTNHPLQVVYELATPLTIQLTPQQVKALVGENHISAPLEGQEIDEVKYTSLAGWNDVVQDDITSLETTWSSDKINTNIGIVASSVTALASRVGTNETNIAGLTTRVGALETNASKITWSNSVNALVDDTTVTISDAKITTASIIEPFYSNASGDNVVVKNQTATTGQVVLTFDALLEATSFRVRITNL